MSNSTPPTSANNNTAVQLAIITLSGLALIVVAFLVYQGKDIKEIAGFAMLLLPLVISNVFMSRQVGKVQDSSDTIKRAVNGELTAKFDAVHTAMADNQAAIEATNNKVEQVHTLVSKVVG